MKLRKIKDIKAELRSRRNEIREENRGVEGHIQFRAPEIYAWTEDQGKIEIQQWDYTRKSIRDFQEQFPEAIIGIEFGVEFYENFHNFLEDPCCGFDEKEYYDIELYEMDIFNQINKE